MATGKFGFNWDAVRDKIKDDESKKGGGKKFEKDTRFYEVNRDANGNAMVIFRFLPDKNGTPYIKYYNHGFEYLKAGAKKWYIQNCVNTFGYDRKCPICEKNMELWKSAFQSDKDIAGKQKRKLSFVSNILIIQDKANPENEGKVFLYRYGQKIADKWKALMFPSEQDQEDPDFVSFVPFDLYEGANFKLKVKKQGEFPNYDDSEFSKQSALFNGDDVKIEPIISATYDLSEFLAPDKFPTNEFTISVLGSVLGISAGENEPEGEPVEDKKETEPAFDFEKKETKKESKKTKKEEPVSEPAEEEASGDPEADDDADFFKTLR